jgi:hypothetical protein
MVARYIQNLEEQLSRRARASSVMAVALRCWQAYRFLEPEHEMRFYLQRANQAINATFRRNTAHVQLYALTIFVSIEAGHYDSANGMLDKALGYKSFLRANEPRFYGQLCFLYAYLEINQNRSRSARKHWRNLIDHAEKNPSNDYVIMLGLLHLAAGEFNEAFNFLSEAYNHDKKNIFLLEGLFRYYKIATGGLESTNILPVLTYAAARGADISQVAVKYSATVSAAIKADPAAGEKLYEASGFPPVLKDICANLIKNNDLSAKAYAFYREAEQKQIFSAALINALVRGAYANSATKINRFPLAKFLAGEPQMDTGLAVFVYFHILTDPALADLLPTVQSKILQLGEKCLKEGITGREVNAIYYYLWSRLRTLGVTGEQLEKIERALSESISLPDAGQETGQNSIELYEYFFQKGDRRFVLLTFLADYYLSLPEPPEIATEVFEALINNKDITKPYRMQLLVVLGRMFYNANRFTAALDCFAAVDEDMLTDDFVEQIFTVYMQAGEYERATKLLASKHSHIPAEVLFSSLGQLLTKSSIPIMFQIGYELLLGGFFSEELLSRVLEGFRATYSEWAALSQVLDEDNRAALALDARLLETALYMASFDQNAQKAFTRLWQAKYDSPLLAEFVELAIYEMLAKSTRPNYDVLNILEKWYLEKEQTVLLAWGLASVYLKYNITTFKSEEIIRFAISTSENEGILFPIFKESKPTSSPFIEKFQPFLYKSLPNKDCKLYYRIDDAANFSSVPMVYVRYGLYVASVPIFFNETIHYYFSEEMASGNINTKISSVKNSAPFLHENTNDPYYILNTAIIYDQMFRHDKVEKLVSELVKDIQPVRAGLL